jgi:hypothetical protein
MVFGMPAGPPNKSMHKLLNIITESFLDAQASKDPPSPNSGLAANA